MSRTSEITWFFVTGFPKSGNKWFQKMLFSFEAVGGFNNRPDRGLPLLATSLIDSKTLAKLLRGEGIAFEPFVQRLYHPGSDLQLNWSPASLPVLHELIEALAANSGKMCRGKSSEAHFRHLFDPSAPALVPHQRWRTVGLPGMHTPIEQVQRLLPSFHIVHLLRDPRDVIVSYFYHQISTLNEETALEMAHLDRDGKARMRDNWKRPFARRIGRRLRKYYAASLVQSESMLRVRYEDLLADGAAEMLRVLRFLNVTESPERIAAVLQRHSFEKRTGSSAEQRGSLRRKGQSGDWRNYFDRELVDELGEGFVKLVSDLGYERDASWAAEVPEQSPRPWDFSRFRIKRSTLRQFIRYWEQSPELREQFPDPWAYDVEPSFYTWLRECEHTDVRRWFDLALQLQELWRVDVAELRPLRGKARRAKSRRTERRRLKRERS